MAEKTGEETVEEQRREREREEIERESEALAEEIEVLRASQGQRGETDIFLVSRSIVLFIFLS